MVGRCDSLLVVRGSLLFDVCRLFSLLFVVCCLEVVGWRLSVGVACC